MPRPRWSGRTMICPSHTCSSPRRMGLISPYPKGDPSPPLTSTNAEPPGFFHSMIFSAVNGGCVLGASHRSCCSVWTHRVIVGACQGCNGVSRHPSPTDLPRSATTRRSNGSPTKGCGRGHISWSRVGPRRTDRPASSSTAPLTHLEMKKHKRSRPKGSRVELPETGVEPARPYGHKHLKLARLPIPPPGRLLPDESTPTRTGVNLAPRFAEAWPFDPWFVSQNRWGVP